MKIALGTAQFGMPYGVANSIGRVPLADVKSILKTADRHGVDTLDTAAGYGDCESTLGSVGISKFKVVTKLPTVIDSGNSVSEWVHTSLRTALENLHVPAIYGLLLHRSDQLLSSDSTDMLRAIDELKSASIIQKFGVSIYDPIELDAIVGKYVPDIVQAPLNLFDRRLETSGWLQRLYDAGVEVHIRSAFLQGLLLCSSESIPIKFKAWSSLFEDWHDWLRRNATSPIEASLAAVSDDRISRIIVGVESVEQLEQILQAMRRADKSTFPAHLISKDLNLIDPSNWDKL